jgi:hypothetical protein
MVLDKSDVTITYTIQNILSNLLQKLVTSLALFSVTITL